MANRIAPGLIDKYLAKAGYSGQLTDQQLAADAPAKLFEPVPGNYGGHGRFEAQTRLGGWEMFTDRYRDGFYLGAATLLGIYGLHLLPKKYKV